MNIFVDALDEGNDEDVRVMIRFFERLTYQTESNGYNLRICFASRYYPHISIRDADHILLEEHAAHLQDIELYIDRNLHHDILTDLGLNMLTRSRGVFLWIVLVIPILNRMYDRGKDIPALRSELDATPQDLHNLFESILLSNMEDFDQCLTLLRLVLSAQQGLNPLAIYSLFQQKYGTIGRATPTSSVKPSSALSAFRSRRLPAEHSDDRAYKTGPCWCQDERREGIAQLIINCSRGLVEITQGCSCQVQFIHETVRAAIQSKDMYVLHQQLVQENPSPISFVEESCHATITGDCIEYLIDRGPHHRTACGRHDCFCAYAELFWVRHFKLSKSHLRPHTVHIAAQYLMSEYQFSSRKKRISTLSRMPGDMVFCDAFFRNESNVTALSRAVEISVKLINPLLTLMQQHFRAEGLREMDPELFFALGIAIKRSDVDAIDCLLDTAIAIAYEIGQDCSLFRFAAYVGEPEVLRRLGSAGADAHGTFGCEYGSPIEIAEDQGNQFAVEAIIDVLETQGHSREEIKRELAAASDIAWRQGRWDIALRLDGAHAKVIVRNESLRIQVVAPECCVIEISPDATGAYLISKIEHRTEGINVSRRRLMAATRPKPLECSDDWKSSKEIQTFETELLMHTALRHQRVRDMTEVRLLDKVTLVSQLPNRDGAQDETFQASLLVSMGSEDHLSEW